MWIFFSKEAKTFASKNGGKLFKVKRDGRGVRNRVRFREPSSKSVHYDGKKCLLKKSRGTETTLPKVAGENFVPLFLLPSPTKEYEGKEGGGERGEGRLEIPEEWKTFPCVPFSHPPLLASFAFTAR